MTKRMLIEEMMDQSFANIKIRRAAKSLIAEGAMDNKILLVSIAPRQVLTWCLPRLSVKQLKQLDWMMTYHL